jgi:ABC-type antimicrobial peptide transport system permease subunit
MEMKDWRLRSNFVNGVQQGGKSEQVNLFAIIAWIIVLLACINFMNLSTARSERRAREVGVRKVLGTSRSSLVGQFMTEAFLMSFIAVVLAVGITALVLPAFNQLVEKTMVLNVFSGNHLMGLLAILLICGLVAGAYPALYLSSFQPIKVLKGLKLPSSGGSAFIRKGLVTLQFVISIALIICTLIIYQQIMHARNRELGWQKENVIYMDQGIVQTRKDSSTDMQFRTLRRALDASGVVSHAALNTNNPFSVGSNSSSYMWKGKDPNADILIGMDFITPEFVGTMGMSLVAGRDFRKDGTEDSASVLINESMARLMTKDAQDAVGQIIDRDESKLLVVGVLKNFVYNNMYGAAEPVIFYNDDKAQYTNMLHIRIKAGTNLGASLEKVKAVLHAHNPVYPVEYKFMDEEFDRLFQGETLVGTLAGLFAALAIFISCLGLFGLAAFTAERRVKEIGIRKVLGTSMTGIVALLSKDFIRIVALSCLISFPISWWAMRQWLDSYAYRVQIQWWMFLLPALLALLIALLTVSIQAIKAAMANPIKALRSE